ncbi:MAG: ISKra4 family transposase [Thioploca sp.]|nr:ISKra4 family transposase [Thioploca sp.]
MEVSETVYRKLGRRLRAFSQRAQVIGRGCSLPLQRVVTDFGAERAFGKVVTPLQEHYGITLPVTTIRRITESHAQRLHARLERIQEYPSQVGCEYLIVQMDGSMIPMVETDKEAKDKRKGKQLSWKEVRLCLAHERGSVPPHFAVSFQESVEQAGEALFDSACRAGFGRQTDVHAVGDGAPWIADQVEVQFGAQGHYLVDFYHVCEYLGNAAPSCAGKENAEVWFEKYQMALKNGHVEEVIEALQPHLETADREDTKAPVRAGYRYLSNRLGQFEYPTAKHQQLPIASGEIESAHRYIIQERLKKPGAWWSSAQATYMFSLRTVRANNQWEIYWATQV